MTRRAALGVSAHLGWAATATLAFASGVPRVLRTDRIELAEDRDVREPFHVAAGFDGLDRVPPPPDPQATLARALRRQRRSAARAIAGLARALEKTGHRIAWVGLLVSRGRAAPDLEKALGSHTQVHIEEGIAVRDSFRQALEEQGARVEPLDQKALGELLAQALGQPEAALREELSALQPENDGAWRKEEKTAALAAWLAWSRSAR